MNDLDQAIETITEGGQALGVSCGHVYNKMLTDEWFVCTMMVGAHSENFDYAHFNKKFDECASQLLKEAQRANLELEAGL